MRYEILGPLRILDGEHASSISARKIQTLLAVLLIRADHLVPVDQLLFELWEHNAPRRANAGLHVYVSQLRKSLSRPDRQSSPIVTKPNGYQLMMGDDELDLHAFLELSKRGRARFRDGQYAQAATSIDRALGLWRGSALDDLPHGPLIGSFVTWLAKEQLDCIELRIEAALHMGQHRETIARLYALTVEYPLRETFHRQLMLALYRSERQADALNVYQAARDTMRRELGLEPCRSLQELQRAILVADQRLDVFAAA